jgi:UDP-N-acetyl-alpha-D-muramoyl-L-alanyl-L-glutamate epimerase
MEVESAHRAAYERLGGTTSDPAFRCLGWTTTGDTVELHYELEGLPALVERVRFPGHDLSGPLHPATAGALDVLHLAAATSYYKAAIPRRVVLPDTLPAGVAMLEALLTHGLAEFGATNDLDLTGWPRIGVGEQQIVAGQADVHGEPSDRLTGTDHAAVADAATRPEPTDPPAGGSEDGERPAGVVVPVGGGKDSAVTAMLAVANGWDAVAFAVNPRASMERTAAATGLPLRAAHRELDPRLLAWNDAGALNGHVPITAIVASIACVAATLEGRGDVLMSNEASADEPTRTVDGRVINHQYSKSSAFETLHRSAMRELVGDATRAISVLRPLPELLVAAVFTHLGAPLAAVNSCNRAYSLTRARVEWCGECPKCLFVQLMLAPFTDPQHFQDATGFDALARADLVERFAELRDPVSKPYECVGTVEEVQLAFDLLAATPRWRDHAAVAAHGDAETGPDHRLRVMIDAVDTSALPNRYGRAIDRELAALREGRTP